MITSRIVSPLETIVSSKLILRTVASQNSSNILKSKNATEYYPNIPKSFAHTLSRPVNSGLGKTNPIKPEITLQTKSYSNTSEFDIKVLSDEENSMQDKTYIPHRRSNIPEDYHVAEGPERLIHADSRVSWVNNQPVKIYLGEDGQRAIPPISVPGCLKQVAERFPESIALASKNSSDQWEYTTYAQYLQDVRTVAKGFIKLGLDRFHGVCILGFNSKEWMCSNLGAIFAGAFGVGIYTTNSPEACAHCAKDCEAQIFVVENEKHLEKILKIKPDLPHLKAIIQYKGKPTHEGVLSWEEVMELGLNESDDKLEERLRSIAINECCSLIYTSGTTGPPKGVMLSHDNLTWTSYITNVNANVLSGYSTVSYLPLSHIAAQISDMYCPLHIAGTVYFADQDALKGGTLGKTIKEVKPTGFNAVPRVYEKMYEKMREASKDSPALKRMILNWAKSVGLEKSLRMQSNNFEKPFGYEIANNLVFKKVKEAVGFDQCNLLINGAAPLPLEVAEFFHSLDIPLIEGYGMTESSGPFCISNPQSFRFSSVGKVYDGCCVKLDNKDKDGNGEICTRGRHVFMGYLNMADTTISTLDSDGFLHTGDIGKFDEDGFLYVTGRLKELIITAGGENIPPVLIEDEIKKNLPCVSNAVLIGNQRKFLTVLLTLKTEFSEDMEPLDELSPVCVNWLKSCGHDILSLSELLANMPENVVRKIQEGIDLTNGSAASNAQKVQKWSILPNDFSIYGGEMGPTLKLKREVVMEKYKETIDKFYE